jgi:hypothetical protein
MGDMRVRLSLNPKHKAIREAVRAFDEQRNADYELLMQRLAAEHEMPIKDVKMIAVKAELRSAVNKLLRPKESEK